MNNLIKVDSEKTYSDICKKMSIEALDHDVIIMCNGKIKMLKAHDQVADIVLDASNDNDKLVIDALYANKLIDSDSIATDKDLALIESIGTIFSGNISGKSLVEPAYLVKDFSSFKYFTGVKSIVGKDENGYCGLFAASSLQTISIPDSINEIEEFAFAFCMNLKSINLNKVTAIKTKSFYYCINLNSITIPASVNVIEANAFGKSGNLKEIVMKSKTPCKVYKDTFTGCSDNLVIKIPKGSLEAYTNAWKYVDASKFIEK